MGSVRLTDAQMTEVEAQQAPSAEPVMGQVGDKRLSSKSMARISAYSDVAGLLTTDDSGKTPFTLSQQGRGLGQGIIGIPESISGLPIILGENIREYAPEMVDASQSPLLFASRMGRDTALKGDTAYIANPLAYIASKIGLSPERKESLKRMGYEEAVINQVDKIGETLVEWGDVARDYYTNARNASFLELDEETFRGGFLDNPSWTRATTLVAQAIPSLGAAAIITGMSGGNPFPAAVFLGVIESEPVYDRAREMGLPQAQKNVLFGVTAAGTTALEFMALSRIMKGPGKSRIIMATVGDRLLPMEVSKQGVKVVGRGLVARLGRSRFGHIVSGMMTEGGQEATQQFWQNLVVKAGMDATQDLFEGVIDSLIAGAGSGGGVSAFVSGRKNYLKQFSQEEIDGAIETLSKTLADNGGDLDAVIKKSVDEIHKQPIDIPGPETGYASEEDIKAENRVMKLAEDLGVKIDKIEYIDEEKHAKWDDVEGRKIIEKAGYNEEEYNAAIKRGERFVITGEHEVSSEPGRQGRSSIRLFRGHTTRDIYHEFAHAVEEQGGLPGWAGTKEQHAQYLERSLQAEDEGAISEFTSEGSKVMAENVADNPEIVITDGAAAVDVNDSVRTVAATKEDFIKANKKAKLFSTGEINKFFKDVDNVTNFIINNPDLLDYEASPFFSAVKKNSDPQYKRSLDFTTMCIKRYVMQKTIDEVQLRLNRPLNADEFMQIRESLRAKGIDTACGACYVETRRMYTETVIQKALEGYVRVENRGKKNEKAIFMKPLKVPRSYLLSMEGLARMQNEFPAEYKKFRKIYAGTQMKAHEPRTEYRGEILKFSKALVESFNSASGMRWQSWSDFELPHLLDGMQAIMDMSVKKLKGHAYTKVTNFVLSYGPTGLSINMSLIPKGTGFDKNGNLVFDKEQSFDFKEGLKLRDKYDNVGFVAIGISDEHIKALLADPRIDYVIPYHASGLSKDFQKRIGMEGWTDYSKKQMYRGKDGKPRAKHPYIADFKGDLAVFDKLMKKAGLTPPFKDMREWKGYEKLLTDRRIWDKKGKYIEQKAVRPDFDMRQINKMLKDYKGGAVEADATTVGDMVGKLSTQASVRTVKADKNFMNWFEGSKVVDKNGDPLVVYHGTTKDFKKFSLGDKGNVHAESLNMDMFFFTDNPDVADTYAKNEWKDDGDIGGNIMPVFLSLKNPLIIDANGKGWQDAYSDVVDELNPHYSKAEVSFRKFRDSLIEKYGETKIRHEFEETLTVAEKKKIDALQEKANETSRFPGKAVGAYPHDGVIIKGVNDPGGEFRSEEEYTPFSDVYVAFDSTQIKSATGNIGTYSPTNKNINASVKRVKSVTKYYQTLTALTEEIGMKKGWLIGLKNEEEVVNALSQMRQQYRDEFEDTKDPERKKKLKAWIKEQTTQIKKVRQTMIETRKESKYGDVQAKLRNLQQGFRIGVVEGKTDVKATQEKLIEILTESELPAKDYKKFLPTIKNTNTHEKLIEGLPGIVNRINKLVEAHYKNILKDKIKAELKATKPIKQGSMRKGKYDYTTNKYFQDLLKATKLNQDEAESLLQALDVPTTEKEAMIKRFLMLKANGMSASLDLHLNVLMDIVRAKKVGQDAKDEASFDKALEREIRIKELEESIADMKGDPDKIRTKIVNAYTQGMGNIWSMLNALYGKQIADDLNPELYENRRDTAMYYKTTETVAGSAKLLGIKGHGEFLSWLTDMVNEEHELIDIIYNKPRKINMLDIMDIYNAVKNDAIRERYYNNFGEPQVKEMIAKLSTRQKAVADYWQAVVQGYMGILNASNIEIKGIDLGRVDNYWPATSERTIIEIYDDMKVQSNTPGSMKERSKSTKIMPKPKNAWFKLQKHIAEGEHVNHLSKKHADLSRLFLDYRVRQDIHNKFGEEVYNTLLDMIENISLHKQTTNLDKVEKWFGKGLNNWVIAKIALNPSVFVKQLISMGNYMEVMSTAEWGKYWAEGIADPQKTWKFMMENVPYLKARYARGMTEAISAAITEANKMSKLKHNWTKAMSSLVRGGDMMAIIYGGYPMIRSLMAKGLSMQDAVDQFESATLKSQQSGLSTSRSQWQNNPSAFARLFLAFKNTPAQYFRKQMDAFISFGHGDISKTQLAKTITIYGVIQPALYGLAGTMMRAALYGDDDWEETWFMDMLAAIALNPFNAIPVLDDVIAGSIRMMQGKYVWKMMSTPMLDDISSSFEVWGKKDIDFIDVVNSFGVIGEVGAGVPVKLFTRIINRFTD